MTCFDEEPEHQPTKAEWEQAEIRRKVENGEIRLYPYQEHLAQFLAAGGRVEIWPRGIGKSIIIARAEQLLRDNLIPKLTDLRVWLDEAGEITPAMLDSLKLPPAADRKLKTEHLCEVCDAPCSPGTRCPVCNHGNKE